MPPLNILLIDDDPDDRFLFAEACKDIGSPVQCSFATNGAEGIHYLETTTQLPDIIFLDINMPVMNGIECLMELKNNRILSSIPVIMYTTSENPHDKKTTSELGAVMYFPKCHDFDNLCEKLKALFSSDLTLLLQQQTVLHR